MGRRVKSGRSVVFFRLSASRVFGLLLIPILITFVYLLAIDKSDDIADINFPKLPSIVHFSASELRWPTESDIKKTEYLRSQFVENIFSHYSQQTIDPNTGIIFAIRVMLAILEETYARLDESIHFIQIGACDGGDSLSLVSWEAANNNTDYRYHRWRGLLLEPVSHTFEILSNKIRNSSFPNHFMLINAALANESGETEFQMFDVSAAPPDTPHWVKYEIGTLQSEDIALSDRLKPFVYRSKVKIMTANDIITQRNANQRFMSQLSRGGIIDVLFVDTEGWDAIVVIQFLKYCHFLQSTVMPTIIVFEGDVITLTERNDVMKLLRKEGYYSAWYGNDIWSVRMPNHSVPIKIADVL